MKKRIVCLANSRKVGGRCIAGKVVPKLVEWIRPVSARPAEEISLTEMQYANGGLPHLLDILEIDHLQPNPKRFQTENHLIDPGVNWVKIGVFPRKDLNTSCDSPDSLWNAHQNSYWGKNDRIMSGETNDLKQSLFLIRIDTSEIVVRDEDAFFGHSRGHKKVRVEFEYNGVDYRLPVTDPDMESKCQANDDGTYPMVTSCYTCISLGLPHTDDFCYLFAAAIIV